MEQNQLLPVYTSIHGSAGSPKRQYPSSNGKKELMTRQGDILARQAYIRETLRHDTAFVNSNGIFFVIFPFQSKQREP